MKQLNRPINWVLCALFVLMSVALMDAADFDFTITARFKNAVPSDSRYPYFDYCGFDCRNSDPRIRFVDQYCDTSCRQFNNVWGPFCYSGERCPNIFNTGARSALQLRWGAPAGESGMSGMGFNYVNNNGRGTFDVQREFKLGDLTHYNFPISASTVVPKFEFEFTLTISRGGKTFLDKATLNFPMNVDETPNNLVPPPCANPTCPYATRLGCANGAPGCPDRIIFTTQVLKDLVFTLSDGSKYTFAITGFRLPGSTATIPQFISDEKMSTTAEIWAVVTRACPDCSKQKNTVPVFNQGTFTCTCVCPETPCPAGQIRQADCECGCPQDVCGVGATAVLRNGKCTCDCTTGDPSKCIKPKLPGVCPNDNSKCCCVCPDNKCPAPAKPSENTADCACLGCPTCEKKGKNWIASTDNCSCICPLSQKNCRADLEVFNANTCECDCKFTTCKDDFVSDNCNCVCNKAKLDAKCQALNRSSIFVPFDPKNPNAAQCTCGPCVGNFKNSTTTGLCECQLECDKTSFFELDKNSCTCKCPPGGPTCPNPQIPNPVTCKCDPCDTTKDKCDCPPARKANCERLKRQYIFNSTFCGCTDCIGQFIDTDPKKESECTQCLLDDFKCKEGDVKSLKVLNGSTCTCVCPTNPKCPNPRDIYEPKTCSCRPCVPGECVCGNGYVEAGELCDTGANATECCKDCILLDGVSCNSNKCGVCKRNGNVSTCVDVSADLCKNDECYSSNCTTKDNQPFCEVTYFDGKACGDGDLCSRRCLQGKCEDYDLTFIANRCSAVPPECGPCCTYTCNKTNGQCAQNWNTLNQGCTDGLLCTVNDTCVPNPGNTTVPLKCEGKLKCTVENLGKPFGAPCTQWECSEGRFGACVEVPVGNETSCPSSGFCSLNGTCSVNGECIQPRRSCNSPDPCKVGRCREDLDQCEFVVDLANGLPCDDGDNCTAGDVCVDGACKGNEACNTTTPGSTIPLIPLVVTAAVVAAAALVAGFFIYQAIQGANIMDPVSWGEVNSSQFDANPLYQEATKFGDNPLYQS